MNLAERSAYLKSQVVANVLINSGLNALIAFFSYRQRANVALIEMIVDIEITVAIIGFLVSWLAILGARKKMQISHGPNSALLGLGFMLAFMLAYGGLVLILPLALLRPGGMPGWGYIVFKTIYTGVCAACAALLAIGSVFRPFAKARETA